MTETAPLAAAPDPGGVIHMIDGRRVVVTTAADGTESRRRLPVVHIIWGEPGPKGEPRTRFQECLDVLHLKRRIFGRDIGAGPSIVDDWGNGVVSVPPVLMEWLEAEVARRLANPPPGRDKWRRRGRFSVLDRPQPQGEPDDEREAA